MFCSHVLQSPTIQLVPPCLHKHLPTKCQYYNWKQLQREEWVLGVEDTDWLESTSLHGNFFRGASGVLLDSKTTELGFSQRTTANHMVWTTFGTLLVAPNNITYPSWLKRFLRATYKMWGMLWQYKELFKSKESGLKYVGNLKNAELHIVGEIEVRNISPFSD